VESSRRVRGADNADTVAAIHKLGRLLERQERFKEAESYFREVLEWRRRQVGAEHPSALRSINELLLVLSKQGKVEEAETLAREAETLAHGIIDKTSPLDEIHTYAQTILKTIAEIRKK
jgi:tetratricopeptide (TPR) repeat protein